MVRGFYQHGLTNFCVTLLIRCCVERVRDRGCDGKLSLTYLKEAIAEIARSICLTCQFFANSLPCTKKKNRRW